MTKSVTLNSKPTLMINVNHGPKLFSVPISYDTTQTHPQTLNTLPRDQPKDPKTKNTKKKPTCSSALDRTEPPKPSSPTVGRKRQNESTDHGKEEAKWIKLGDNNIQTDLSTVEADAQPHQSQ